MHRSSASGPSSALTGIIIDAAKSTPVPSAFLTDVAPAITSMEELQVMLGIFRIIHESGDMADPIGEKTLMRDRLLRSALRVPGSPRSPDTRISKGLELSLARGTLVRLVSAQARKRATWYYLNTPENRATLRLMESGQLPAPRALWPDDVAPSITIDRPNAFRLYEQNIGPLTPLIADQIARAIEEYPDDWIEDAFEEAVAYNRRSWRYVSRILENWTVEGRRTTSD
jgi:DnaD/phage-associated family protein